MPKILPRVFDNGNKQVRLNNIRGNRPLLRPAETERRRNDFVHTLAAKSPVVDSITNERLCALDETTSL